MFWLEQPNNGNSEKLHKKEYQMKEEVDLKEPWYSFLSPIFLLTYRTYKQLLILLWLLCYTDKSVLFSIWPHCIWFKMGFFWGGGVHSFVVFLHLFHNESRVSHRPRSKPFESPGKSTEMDSPTNPGLLNKQVRLNIRH